MTRLALFVAALVAVFAASFGVGQAWPADGGGATTPPATGTGGADHGGHP